MGEGADQGQEENTQFAGIWEAWTHIEPTWRLGFLHELSNKDTKENKWLNLIRENARDVGVCRSDSGEEWLPQDRSQLHILVWMFSVSQQSRLSPCSSEWYTRHSSWARLLLKCIWFESGLCHSPAYLTLGKLPNTSEPQFPHLALGEFT